MVTCRRWCRVTIVGPDGQTLASALLSGPGAPDLLAVDAVSRLSLVAHGAGATVRVTETCPELGELLDLAGLAVEVDRQTEEGEDALEVEQGEEEAQPGDLAL